MLNLAIDIGNSYIKAGIFDGDKLLETLRYEALSPQIIDSLVNSYDIKRSVISGVKKSGVDWEDTLRKRTSLSWFTKEMAYGVQNHYQSPETLGLDRLAGISGARYIYPEAGNLVIDGGTCITYDYVDNRGNYFGGSISPGLKMRYKALNYFTEALPLITADENFVNRVGTGTASAITSGVQNGIKYELIGFIESYLISGGSINIVLTGGDSIFFDTLLKNSIFAPYIKNEPALVLKGLNAAIQQH